MPHHIREVIRLKDGKEYREGKDDESDATEVVTNANEEACITDVRPYNSKARRMEYARRAAAIRAGDDDDWNDC